VLVVEPSAFTVVTVSVPSGLETVVVTGVPFAPVTTSVTVPVVPSVVVLVELPSAFSVLSVTVPSGWVTVVFFGKPVGCGSTTTVVTPPLTVVVVTFPLASWTVVVVLPSA
jgi:hypothetical protein